MPDPRRLWRERRLLTGVALLLASLRIALTVLPFRMVLRLFDTPPRRGMRPPSEVYRRRVVWAVDAVGRRMLGSRPCLAQALAVRWMFRRHGEETALRIGVRRGAAGRIEAHAWLERDGAIVIGGHDAPGLYHLLQSQKS